MKKTLLALAGLLLAAGSAFGGTIIVSGDVSIAGSNALDVNGQFFRNVLGSGTSVVVQNFDPAVNSIAGDLAGLYNALPGVTATQTSTQTDDLSGIDVLFSFLPQSAYSVGQISAMQALLSSGGTVFFLADSSGYAAGGVAQPIISNTVALLGGSMTVSGNDQSLFPVTGVIFSDPLTAGVTTFRYGFTGSVSNGTPLFGRADGTPIVAYETIGAVPEPGSVSLFAAGAVALIALRRRRA
jgi:hypothetical protein